MRRIVLAAGIVLALAAPAQAIQPYSVTYTVVGEGYPPQATTFTTGQNITIRSFCKKFWVKFASTMDSLTFVVPSWPGAYVSVVDEGGDVLVSAIGKSC
jgi:hypothetical protein